MIKYRDDPNYKHKGVLIVDYENGVKLGNLAKSNDGYFVFWPDVKEGFWSEDVLRAICDKLKDLNAAWDLQVQTYMAQEKKDGILD